MWDFVSFYLNIMSNVAAIAMLFGLAGGVFYVSKIALQKLDSYYDKKDASSVKRPPKNERKKSKNKTKNRLAIKRPKRKSLPAVQNEHAKSKYPPELISKMIEPYRKPSYSLRDMLIDTFVSIHFDLTHDNFIKASILSVSLVEYQNGHPTKRYIKYVNPNTRLSRKAKKALDINKKMLKKEPIIDEAIEALYNDIRWKTLVVYDADITMRHLIKALDNAKIKYPQFTVVDLKYATQKYLKKPKKKDLKSLKKHYQLDDKSLVG